MRASFREKGWALWAAALLALLLASSCGRGPDVLGPAPRLVFHPPVFGPSDSVFTDDQLVSAAYSSYSVPLDFYDEGALAVPVYYVNNGSIEDSRVRPPLPWTELATEDVAQARAWAEASVANANRVARVAADAPFVTDRYFEFADEPGPGVTHVRMRVHRSSYVSDFLTSQPDPASSRGTFHLRPVVPTNVRFLAEYLWTHHGERFQFGTKVLSSYSSACPEEVVHTMYVVQLTHGHDGLSDWIALTRLTYRVDRTSGAIRITTSRIRELLGR